jgi:hypothetical protein
MRSGGKETGARQRPSSGWLPISEVRFASPNPFETKRNLGAQCDCSDLASEKLAEDGLKLA